MKIIISYSSIMSLLWVCSLYSEGREFKFFEEYFFRFFIEKKLFSGICRDLKFQNLKFRFGLIKTPLKIIKKGVLIKPNLL
jgi:hypothetical protein